MHGNHTDIEIPRRLRARPKWRGFPVPYLVLFIDGTPDFRITDDKKWDNVVNFRLCQLCGEKLGVHIFFIGGPKTHESRLFYDPPMHKDCAEYAVKVCPFLARTEWEYSTRPLPEGGYRVETVNECDRVRPEKMGLFRTDGYKVVQVQAGGKTSRQLFLKANPFNQETWF